MWNGSPKVQNQSSGLLTIRPATAADVGEYECQAFNVWGTAISNTVEMALAFINEFTDRVVRPHSSAIGASATLVCRSPPSSAPQAIYSWAHFASTQDQSGTPVTTDNRRQIDQETGILYFANAQTPDRLSDKQLYACLANIATTAKVGSYWNWTISGLSSGNTLREAFRNPKTDTVTVLKGEEAPFKCFFYGIPTPTIRWTRDGSNTIVGVTDSNTSYVIAQVQESDDGSNIRCIASNSGTTATAQYSFTLVVEISPEFDANNTGPANINGTKGDTVSFGCNSHAKPDATVTWFINGTALDANALWPRYAISDDTLNLTISNINENDTAVVTCKASNTHGYSLAQGSLIVLDPTTVSGAPESQSVPLGQPATFSCGATFDPATPGTFNWTFNGTVIDYDQNDVYADCSTASCDLKIVKVEERHGGYYECIVTNGHSEDTSEPAYLELLPPIVVFSAATIWYVFLIIGLLLLILLVVIFLYCYCKDNDGDSYPVDEMENKNGNNPEKELRDTGFKDFDPPPPTAPMTGQVWSTGNGFTNGTSSRLSDNASVKYRADPTPMTFSDLPPPVYSLQQNVGYAVDDSASTLPRGQYVPAPPNRSRPQTPRSPAGLEYPVLQPALRSPPYQQQQQQQPPLWIDEQPEREFGRPMMFSSFQPNEQDQFYPDSEFDDGRRDVRVQPPPPISPVVRYDPRMDPRNQYELGGDAYPQQYGGAVRAPSESSV